MSARSLRLWQFIVVPGAAMAGLILLFRSVDALLPSDLSPPWLETYQVARTVVIGALMAVVIGWIAVRYRRQYEVELQQRNAALEATGDFLKSIIEASAEAIVTRDAQGGVTSWNRAAEAIYGWRAAEILGRSTDRLRSPEAPEDDSEAIERALRDGRTIHDLETVHRRKDGSTIRVRMTLAPLYDRTGGWAGSTAIIRDVTRLKEMEVQLVERERLAALGEMAAQVAHEVRNPLAGIRGACDVALSGYGENDPRREIVDEVRHQIDRLNQTVEDLLVFARPRPKRVAPTDVNRLIERVVTLLGEDPRANGTAVECRLEPALPTIEADSQQIEQVLMNLLVNALQATERGGAVEIATRGRPGGIEISVRDSGPGLPAGRGDEVFKPFFTTRTRGTGLGLAIVRNIVLAHGGSVRAANLETGGAAFEVWLPARGSCP